MAGCYVLCDGRKTFYVGQTIDVLSRISEHGWRIHPGGVTTKAGFLAGAVVKVRPSQKYGDWLMVEARLIKRLDPSLNKQKPKVERPKSTFMLVSRQPLVSADEQLYSIPKFKQITRLSEAEIIREFGDELVWAVPVSSLERRKVYPQGGVR